MNYVLSFCKITAASKLFSRNFYLPLLKPLTPKDALRTFRITGKWLLGSKIQHYIPTLLNHTKKRSKKEKNYGKIKHEIMEDYTYMMPIIDPRNIESHKNLCNILEDVDVKQAFIYTVDDKNYNLVVTASLEFAIRNGDIIDVLMSQGTDKILIKLKDFKKIPVELQQYTGNDKLYKGEGTTTKEDEKFHHHGKLTMSIAKIFEDKERKEEEWEKELKRLLQKRKKNQGEGTKEWNEMIKAATANMDWKKYEKQAKRIVQYVEEPIVEYHIGMEVEDFDKTKNANEALAEAGESVLNQLPTLDEIPELINNMSEAVLHEIEIEENDSKKRVISGAKLTLPSGKECFIVGQMVKCEEGDVFVPGQTIENEFGIEYAPGITIVTDNKPSLINGLIVGDSENRNPMFAPTESTITEAGHLSFTTTHEERVKYKPRKVPVRKVIKSVSQNPEDTYEEYYYDDQELEDGSARAKKKLRRVVKKRKVAPPGCVYNVEDENNYEEEEYSEYEEFDEDEEERRRSNELLQEEEKANALKEIVSAEQLKAETKREPTLEEIIENYRNSEDPRITAYREQLEEERLRFKAIDAKITELIVNIESKTEEVREKLEELRNLTVVQEIDPVSTASIEDAAEIASKITNRPSDANVISDILLTMVRRVITFPDKNNISIENINNYNTLNNDLKLDDRNRRYEKLKITLKTAMVAASNVFKNRPQDEVSALKAIGTVLTLAFEDQDQMITDLCYLLDDPMERNEVCALLLKELSQKQKKNKIKTLKSVIKDADRGIKDDNKIVEKLKDVLERRGNIIGGAFKKIVKSHPEILKKIIEFVKPEVDEVKSECYASQVLQNAIVKAVTQITEDSLKNFVENASQNDIEELVTEAVGFSNVLGLNGVAQDLLNLPSNLKLVPTSDKTSLTLLKRLILIRKLAQYDNGQTAALKEIRKNPDFGKTNPRIRQLIRESATLVANPTVLTTSKQIPAKLLESSNHVALEDFLIQKSRIDFPVLVSKNGRQAIFPPEVANDVLDGRIPYVLLDEDGISNIKAVRKFSNGSHVTEKSDYDKKVEEYSPFGVSNGKKSEKWAEVPDFGKMDKLMREAPILMATPPPPQPLPQPPPEQFQPSTAETPQQRNEEEEEQHLPILVSTSNAHVVYPTEARRDVLAGRVAYIYIDESGASIFKPKHIFTALKLNKHQQTKYMDYSCIGAHQRLLETKPSTSRRRCDSEESTNSDEGSRRWAMSSFPGGSGGPRA